MSVALRIGLAGLGVHGERYARHLLAGDVRNARLTAVSRSDQAAGQSFATEHGLAFVGDPAELATRPDIDAVVLALPPRMHVAVAGACVAAQRPVLVEKPMATTASEARRLKEQVDAGGSRLMVAQTLRFDPLLRRMRDECAGLGPLRTVSINQRFEPSNRPWIDSPGCGGMMLNTGVHGFDLLRFLTGLEPESVCAEAGRALTRQTEDQYAAIFRLQPGNVIAVVDNARSSRSRSGRIELVGADAQLWGDHIHRTLQRVTGRDRTDLGEVPPVPTVPTVMQDFVDGILQDTPPSVTVDDGLAVTEMIESAAHSAAVGRRVSLDEFRPGR